MIRFILKRKIKDGVSGYEGEDLYTIDGDLAKLEDRLKKRALGDGYYEVHELIGFEIIYKEILEEK